MKKTLILLLALLLLVCAGCRADHAHPADSDTAKAYFLRLSLDPWGDWMAAENTGIRLDQPVEELAKALVEAMKSPKNTVHASLLEESMTLRKVELEDDLLTFTFDDDLRRMEDYRRLMLCAALSRTAEQFAGVERILVRDSFGAVKVELPAGYARTDPEDMAVYANEATLFLNRPQGTRLEQVRRTVYTDSQELTLEQSLDLLFSLHGVTGLHAAFDGTVTGYDLEVSDGICRVNIRTAGEQSSFDALDIFGLVNTLSGVEGESRFLLMINSQAPSFYGIQDCDGILFYDSEYIN